MKISSSDLTAARAQGLTEQCEFLAALLPVVLEGDTCNRDEDPLLAQLRKSRWTYTWSTGETTPEIRVDPDVPTEYAVTVSNSCYSHDLTWQVEPCPRFGGEFPDLIYPNAFTPNASPPNDVFQIFDRTMDKGDRPAYNALAYTFKVFDRYSHVVVEKSGGTDRCTGFANGEISNWDGRANKPGKVTRPGELLPQEVHTWGLYLRNCRFKNGRQVISQHKCFRILFWEICRTVEFDSLTIIH